MTLATIVLAAGQGTRMKSSLPKVLHELAGAPMVLAPIHLALDLGSAPTVLVVGHRHELVERAVAQALGAEVQAGRVRFALQSEQRGTGHAVIEAMKALPSFDGRVLILYGDVPLLRQETVEALFRAQGRAPLAFISAELAKPTGYGRVVRDEAGQVSRIVEEKDATAEERTIREVNAGIYAADASFLREALGRLDNANAQGEYYLTDIVALAIRAGAQVPTHQVADPCEVEGINTRAQLSSIGGRVRHRIAARLSELGVTVVDPESTYIASTVEIGPDTIVEPGVHLRGRTRIGAHCHIDAGSILTDAILADEVRVHPYSVLDGATVGTRSIVGPFARLRPGAELLEGAHVGNFVELKKTRLGRGSKANHLAYLGDAQIGDGANIGAGTITCNYDGFGKYATSIGDRVFIGSNATLVAPLEIAEDAYVAAGSTITDPVGSKDLAFGRARQTTKPGRAEQLRAQAAVRAKERSGDKGRA